MKYLSKISNISVVLFTMIVPVAKDFLFVLKHALSLAIFVWVLSFVISTIPDIFNSISTIGESEILSFARPTLDYESPVSISYILWVGGVIGFLVGWAIGWQRLQNKKLYRIHKRVYKK